MSADGAGALGSPAALALAALAALLLAALLVFRLCGGGGGAGGRRGAAARGKGNAALILGQCGAGKTCLFYRLAHDTFPDTISSLEPQDRTGPLKLEEDGTGAARRLLDFPGHARLRPQLIEGLQAAGCVVFVLDATNHDPVVLRELADLMYDVFAECIRINIEPPVLVACNKSDLPGAASPEALRKKLAKELDGIKTTRHTLDTEGDDAAEIVLGTDDSPFDFDVDAGCPVSFASVSALKGGADVDAVVEHIAASLSS